MISIFLIKTALMRFGIIIESVTFNADREQIIIIYTRQERSIVKIVPFSEIEELFTSAPEAPAASQAGDLAPGHTITPQ